MKAIIDGNEVEIESIFEGGHLKLIETVDGEEYYVAADREQAGEAAQEYWEEMAEHDRDEFVLMVGADNLVAWALGELAGPGSTKVRNLQEWFELWLDSPEEQWASYDGQERDGYVDRELGEALGFSGPKAWKEFPVTFYRHN